MDAVRVLATRGAAGERDEHRRRGGCRRGELQAKEVKRDFTLRNKYGEKYRLTTVLRAGRLMASALPGWRGEMADHADVELALREAQEARGLGGVDPGCVRHEPARPRHEVVPDLHDPARGGRAMNPEDRIDLVDRQTVDPYDGIEFDRPWADTPVTPSYERIQRGG